MLYVSQRTKEKLEKKKKVIFYTSTSCVSLRNILAVVLCSIQVVKRIGIQNYKNTILWISAVSNSKLHNKIRQLTRFIKTNFQYLFSEPYNYSVYSWILFFLKLSLYWICTILLMLFMSWFLGHRAYGILVPQPGIPGVPLKFQHEIAPSFEVRWECLDSFPNQAGKWTLTRVLPQLHPGYPKLERWGERVIYIEMRKEFSIKRIEERREADMPWFTQKANKIPSQGTYTIHVGHQCPFE